MRILFLADAGSSHSRKWLSGLQLRGVSVALFSLTPVKDDFYSERNIPVRAMNYTLSTGRMAHKVLYFKAIPLIKEMISEFRPNAVHAHYASSYGLLGALAKPQKFCISVWGTDVYTYPRSGAFYKFLLRWTLSKADRIFSTSRDMAKETAMYTPQKISVIPFGIDLEKFKAGIKVSPLRCVKFASAKSLKPVYNVAMLMNSFLMLRQRYPDHNIELHVAGDGPERERCKSIAGDEEGKSIFFSGAVIPENMPQFFADKHVLINIPISESFGVSILEASACELAVIATRAGGIPEVINESETGFFIEEAKSDLLFEAMERFILHPHLIVEMGAKGRKFVIENYNFENCLDKQVGAYQEMIED